MGLCIDMCHEKIEVTQGFHIFLGYPKKHDLIFTGCPRKRLKE